MTETKLKTSWDDHYMLSAYLGSLRWALGEKPVVERYRAETGDRFVPASTPEGRMIDSATGADIGFLQRFSDWHEANVFGRREDVVGGDE